MIIEKDSQKVQTIGLDSTSGFKINATAKAFAILSSGLYSNKIRAIVRELSCNAYDSHKAANKEHVPFKVVLPSPLDPTFSVQDFGLGLSEDQVFNLYTTYFESTKTQSNDYIGALGLGSKSPFSYTSSFLVMSVFEGMKTTYLAFLADEGFPSISKVSSEECSEENGVTISFNVKSADFDKFQEEASFVFSTFPVQPILIGYKYQPENIPVLYSDSKIFSSVIKHRMNKSGGMRVVQGNIAYPLSFDSFDSDQFTKKFAKEISLEQVKELCKKLQNFSLDICVPIGTCDIAASRESLSYDKETIANLSTHIIDFVKTIYDAVMTEVAKESKFVSQCSKYGEVIDTLSADLAIKEGWGDRTIHSLLYTLLKGKLDLGLGDILATSTSDKFNASVSFPFSSGINGAQIYAWQSYDISNDKATKRTKSLEYCGRLHQVNPISRGKIIYNLNAKAKFVKCDSRDWRATLKYLVATDKSFSGCKVYAFFNADDVSLAWKQFDDFLVRIDRHNDVIATSSIDIPKAARAKTEKTDFRLPVRMLDHASIIEDYFSPAGKKNKMSKTIFTNEVVFDNYVTLKSDDKKRFYLIAGKNSAKHSVYTVYKNFDGAFIDTERDSNHNISRIVAKIDLSKTILAIVDEKHVDVLKKKGFTCFWDKCSHHISEIYENTREQAIVINAVKKALNDHPDHNMLNKLKGAVNNEWHNNILAVNSLLKTMFPDIKGVSEYFKSFYFYSDKVKPAVISTESHVTVNDLILKHPLMANIIKDKYDRDSKISDRLAKQYMKLIDIGIERYGIIWCMNSDMLTTEVGKKYIKNVFEKIGV